MAEKLKILPGIPEKSARNCARFYGEFRGKPSEILRDSDRITGTFWVDPFTRENFSFCILSYLKNLVKNFFLVIKFFKTND